MSKQLWIDDLRTPPDGWDWAKTSEEAIEMLAVAAFNDDPYEEVSFDHDLGGEDTTRPVVIWMCSVGVFPPICHVHTANPPGRIWLEGMINHYGPGVIR